MSSPKINVGKLFAPIVLAALTVGCADYANHRDTITLRAGDAAYANAAIHTINPWPPEGFEIVTLSDGRRVIRAIRQYTAPKGGRPSQTVDITVN